MSLIFGILQYDASVDEKFFGSMYAPLKNFPQQKFDRIVEKEAAFGKILNYGTPEDIYDAQPIYLSEPNILFVGQGRVDNREELSRQLNLKTTDQISDSYYILQAYLKYGEQTQHKLKGDWSFAAYHFTTKELFIARDTTGYTSLFFYNTDKYFAFSSSIKSILALPDFKKQLNEEYFASSVSFWKREEKLMSNETFFRNVYHLQNGYTLKLKERETHINKYWPPENIQEIHYKNKQDYADEMLERMYNAVNVRLRSYKPVASMLSGGLDSSTVTYIAADLLKKQNKTLTTFSHVPLFKNELQNASFGKSRTLDETPLMQATVNASGNINPQYLTSADISPYKGYIECMEALDGFIHGAGNSSWLIDIYSTSYKQGFGTLLTGEGGNGSISFSGLNYLVPHNLKSLIKSPYKYLKRRVAKPILLKYAPSVYKNNSLENYANDSYLSKELMTKFDIIKDIRNNKTGFVDYYSDVLPLKKVFIQLYSMRSVLGGAFGNYYGIELRDPTSDIDVMNFFLTIPNEVFFDENLNERMLVKRMMNRRLPDSVLYSKKKGLQSADIFFRVQASKKELLNEVEELQNNEIISNSVDIKKLGNNLKIYLDTNTIPEAVDIMLFLKILQVASFLKTYF
ncbi:asparagine synthetase B family protein [Emticicia fontis]